MSTKVEAYFKFVEQFARDVKSKISINLTSTTGYPIELPIMASRGKTLQNKNFDLKQSITIDARCADYCAELEEAKNLSDLSVKFQKYKDISTNLHWLLKTDIKESCSFIIESDKSTQFYMPSAQLPRVKDLFCWAAIATEGTAFDELEKTVFIWNSFEKKYRDDPFKLDKYKYIRDKNKYSEAEFKKYEHEALQEVNNSLNNTTIRMGL